MASRYGDGKKKAYASPNVTWKHIWSLDETQDALCNSPFRTVPTEIMLRIFQSLSVYDLENISLVCRSFKMIVDRDEIWKPKCNTSAKLLSKSYKQIYMEWIYEKHLRNEELALVEFMYRNTTSFACLFVADSVFYPVRPKGVHQIFTPIGGFIQHPNSSSELTIEVTVDLDKTMPELISLLQKAFPFQDEWRKPAIMKQMITRYYRFMQLKSFYPQNMLVPTLDIEIVWQTHLLRPTMYREDCLRLFHRVIDHSLLTNDIEQFVKEQAFIETCQLYEQRFGEQYCPLLPAEEKEEMARYVPSTFCSPKCIIPVYSYWDKTYFQFSINAPSNYENPFSFTEADIILDSQWLSLCERFMLETLKKVNISSTSPWNPDLSGRIDLRPAAIKRLKKSYERFLYMAVTYPPIDGYPFVHPTYAIDIVWHSHMQEPLKYASDSIRLVGYIIDHTPWPWIEMSKVLKSCENTNDNWKLEFSNEISTDHLYNVERLDDELLN